MAWSFFFGNVFFVSGRKWEGIRQNSDAFIFSFRPVTKDGQATLGDDSPGRDDGLSLGQIV